ncbi:MAG: GNAT family N-acetyltransferase [Hyphomicrobiaceae bacterium]
MIAIRPARDDDAGGIRAVHEAAFGQPAESRLVDMLTAGGHVTLSLVADLGVAIVGHVLLSRLDSPLGALALAPLAVLPSHQRLGIGSTLVETAINLARKRGAYPGHLRPRRPGLIGTFRPWCAGRGHSADRPAPPTAIAVSVTAQYGPGWAYCALPFEPIHPARKARAGATDDGNVAAT